MAIRWDNSHDTQRRSNKWQLRRTPQGGKLKGLILTDQPLGVWTHYYGGRTVPCESEACPACIDGQNPRKHWYVAQWDPTRDDRWILELTDRGADELILQVSKGARLRGRHLTTYRTNSRANGPVEAVLGEDHSSRYQLPPAPDIRQALLIIWGIETPDNPITGERGTVRVRGYRRRKGNDHGTNQPPNAGTNGTQQPGRLGSTHGLHEQAAENGRVPEESTFEPSHD